MSFLLLIWHHFSTVKLVPHLTVAIKSIPATYQHMQLTHHILPLSVHSILQLPNEQSTKSAEQSHQNDSFYSVIINQWYDKGKWKDKPQTKDCICRLCELISCIYIVDLSCIASLQNYRRVYIMIMGTFTVLTSRELLTYMHTNSCLECSYRCHRSLHY